jgi:pseudouridine synthase
MKIILQKIIAQSGYASRRQAEKLVRDGQVRVNGLVAVPGTMADPKTDKITVKNRPIGVPAQKIYLKLNKPIGYTCTNRSFPGEKNIFDLIKIPERLFAVGRLDKNSRGLVLLTNDGDLTQSLAHPKFAHEKIYEVKIAGEIKSEKAIRTNLMKGVDIGEGDGIAKVKRIEYLQNNLFIITLTEGKKRQIRRMFRVLGIGVVDLRRTEIDGLKLGGLAEGKWVRLSDKEIENLTKKI